jgi:adenylyl-sulfate kinase
VSRPLRSENVVWHAGHLNPQRRRDALGYRGATVWMTGLPASGKSSIAIAAEARLVADGRPAIVLDGDNLRHGLNGDLGFSPEDRSENVRRTAHAAALLAEAGVVALASLVSPYRGDRETAREIHARRDLPFAEVWVATPLEECERRDPKGLYARARAGELQGLTGVDAPYEPPESPELALHPEDGGVQEATRRLLELIAGLTG